MAELAIEGDRDGALHLISHVIHDGVTTESALVHLVAPAARLLGNQWDDGAREFAEVVKGLDVLRQLIPMVKLSAKR